MLHNRWGLGVAKSVMKVGFPSKQVVRHICLQVACWGEVELEGAAVESRANPKGWPPEISELKEQEEAC